MTIKAINAGIHTLAGRDRHCGMSKTLPRIRLWLVDLLTWYRIRSQDLSFISKLSPTLHVFHMIFWRLISRLQIAKIN